MTASVRHHCCDRLSEAIAVRCSDHDDPYECPDVLVVYVEKFDEYGLVIHDGGSSYVVIQYCPWCGRRLPEAKRDRWFEELEALGFDDPAEQDIPTDFKTDAWWKKT